MEKPTYTENIRNLTTAAEQDDAIAAGKILSDLGPEQWSKAVQDMTALNRQDWQSHLDINVPLLSVEMVSSGNKETLKIIQQPTTDDQRLQPVAAVTADTTGKKLDNPVDPTKDLVRQLTTLAENGDAVGAARALQAAGSDKWGQLTKDMIALNKDDRKAALDDPNGHKFPARLTISYKQDGPAETLRVYQQGETQLRVPLVTVTDRH